MIKHISFDLWGTLIKSNPQSETLRAHVFHEYVRNRVQLYEVARVISEVKKSINAINEGSGDNLSLNIMISMVLDRLGVKSDPMRVHNIKKDLSEIFHYNGPTLINDNILNFLTTIQQMGGITMNICSNTAFAPSYMLSHHVTKLGLKQFMAFKVYSDIIGVSKPNPVIFRHVYEMARQYQPDLKTTEVLHVGDDLFTDSPCSLVGMEYFDIAHGFDNLINYLQTCRVSDTLNTKFSQSETSPLIQ